MKPSSGIWHGHSKFEGDLQRGTKSKYSKKETFKEVYLGKFAFLYIAIGYFVGVFGSINSDCKTIVAVVIIVLTIVLMALSHLAVGLILKFNKDVNRELSNEELIFLGIEPDMENISNEEIRKICR